eukprot:COSAG01_NODE_514_length_16043_cov_248.614212_5_plen_129_part_00
MLTMMTTTPPPPPPMMMTMMMQVVSGAMARCRRVRQTPVPAEAAAPRCLDCRHRRLCVPVLKPPHSPGRDGICAAVPLSQRCTSTTCVCHGSARLWAASAMLLLCLLHLPSAATMMPMTMMIEVSPPA